MTTEQTSTLKSARGRPKTLNCEETINIAMQEYWLDENNDISLNEICKRAKVSKPGIYREFGNEDGLMEAVLLKYENDVTSKLLNILNTKETLAVKIEKIADYMTLTTKDVSGCLLVKIKNAKVKKGPKSQKQICAMQDNLLEAYEQCIKNAIADGQFKSDISTKLASEYFNAQVNNAALLILEGKENKKVRDILILSLSIFI